MKSRDFGDKRQHFHYLLAGGMNDLPLHFIRPPLCTLERNQTMSKIADNLKRRRRKLHPDGVAIEPQELLQGESDDAGESSCSFEQQQQQQQGQQSEADDSTTANLFVTMVRHIVIDIFLL